MVTNEDIKKEAYSLWEKAGKPEGRDLEFWDAAKKSFYSLSIKNFKDAITIIEGDKNKSPRLGWTSTQTLGFSMINYAAMSKMEIFWSKNTIAIDKLAKSIDKIRKSL